METWLPIVFLIWLCGLPVAVIRVFGLARQQNCELLDAALYAGFLGFFWPLALLVEIASGGKAIR